MIWRCENWALNWICGEIMRNKWFENVGANTPPVGMKFKGNIGWLVFKIYEEVLRADCGASCFYDCECG